MTLGEKPTEIKKEKTSYGNLISGGIAGGISRTVTSPLERLRII